MQYSPRMDPISLLATVAEIRRRLLGTTVRSVRPAGMHGLWIECVSLGGVEGLLATAEEALPRLVLGAARAPRERALPPLAGVAQRVLPGLSLGRVEQRGLDRAVTLIFEGSGTALPLRLVAELFGSRPNLVLVESASDRILEMARHPAPEGHRGYVQGGRYDLPPTPSKPDPRLLGDPAAMAAILAQARATGVPAVTALQEAFLGISPLWAREICVRAGTESPPDLAAALARLLEAAAAGPGDAVLVLDVRGAPEAASPIRLQHLPDERQRPMPTLGEAIELLALHRRSRLTVEGMRRELERILRHLAERLTSRRTKLVAEAAEFDRSEEYRHLGEVLVAHQEAVPRGAASFELPDYARGPDATVTIPLDPAMSPSENAERLFQAARRGRRGTLRVAGRLAETEAEQKRLQAWEERLRVAERGEDLEALLRDLEAVPRLLTSRDREALAGHGAAAATAKRRPAGAPAKPARPPEFPRGLEPRRFVSSEGLPILVGRDNAGNDHLTLHVARSEDLWLHAEGFPGSHVVVRMQGRGGGVPRRTLVEAAQLAAYYSQARSHGKVAVSYTLKKYVRKPRKSPPGLVTVTHEKSLVVKPDKELVARLAVSGGDAGD